MMISYKYPIFPSNITQWKLAENLDACRWLYNRLLEDLNDAKEKGIKLKTYDTQNMIPSLKLENPKLNLVYSKVLQMVNYTLWSNFKGLAASKKNGLKIGHVRFKGYGWYNTMNYNQSGFKIDQDLSKDRRLHQSRHNQERRREMVRHSPGRSGTTSVTGNWRSSWH
jgi:putative transposase